MTVVVHSNAGSQRKRTIPPFLLYIAQLFGVYPITLLAGMPLFFVFAKLGIDGSHGDGVNFAGFGALICLFMGALLGHIFGIRWPSLVPTGRWVWAAETPSSA